MPTKGSVLLYNNRDHILNKTFYKERLVEKNDVKLSYNECKDVIHHSLKIVSNVIQQEVDGFKLPLGMGYLCAVKYVPNKPLIDWGATNLLKQKGINKYVYFTNMHTDGHSCKIQWFRVGRVDNLHFHEVFKFKAVAALRNPVSALFKKGKAYHAWTISDFIEKGRLENLYNKRYRKDLNKE